MFEVAIAIIVFLALLFIGVPVSFASNDQNLWMALGEVT